ncbi:sugar phosphate isomerase/epimerase [soil metagenome]
MNRRSFLGTLGATSLAGLAGGYKCGAFSNHAAGDATEGALGPAGLQLYTVRGAMATDFHGTLARVAAVGYREVEFAGYFGRSAEDVRTVLVEVGLVAPAGHFSLNDLERRWNETVAFAAAVGHEYVVLPWHRAERRRNLADYRQLARLCNDFGARCRDAGLTFAYHNHDFEFIPMEGVIPYDVLTEETDPELVKLELDLYWIRKGGQDALRYFARYPGRFPAVHLKDSAGPPDERMVEVGSGVIDWKAILGAREQAGIRHLFVEHDNPADPFGSISQSFRYLRDLRL